MEILTKECASCGAENEKWDSAYCHPCKIHLCDDRECLFGHLWVNHRRRLNILRVGFWKEED